MKKFKHSGNFGNLIYSLPIVKHFGGGEFYLHLGQIENMAKFFYNATVPPIHRGRLNMKDFTSLKPLMEAQEYITKFDTLDPKNTEITHNLDRFRQPFVNHPGNYVDIYAGVFGIHDEETRSTLRGTQWLTVPETKTIPGRDIIISRTDRWLPPKLSEIWQDWKSQGIPDRAVFMGLPEEHAQFKQTFGWDIPHQSTENLLEMAQYIAGSQVFIGNQSLALSIAIGLGHEDIWCEARRDLPIERNGCYFPKWQGIHYF